MRRKTSPSEARSPTPPRGLVLVRRPGGTFLLIEEDVSPPAPPTLTAAEEDVLRRLRSGSSIDDISAARGTSVRTTRNQLARLMEKLGTRTIAELAGSPGDRLC